MQALEAGGPVSLTLCGERRAQTWSGKAQGWARRLAAMFAGKQVPALLEAL